MPNHIRGLPNVVTTVQRLTYPTNLTTTLYRKVIRHHGAYYLLVDMQITNTYFPPVGEERP